MTSSRAEGGLGTHGILLLLGMSFQYCLNVNGNKEQQRQQSEKINMPGRNQRKAVIGLSDSEGGVMR